jgi:hypothetical protein
MLDNMKDRLRVEGRFPYAENADEDIGGLLHKYG